MEKCDCLDYCGDDPRVGRGEVEPCINMLMSAVNIRLRRAMRRVIMNERQPGARRLRFAVWLLEER